MKPSFHKLPQTEVDSLIVAGATWGEIMEKYDQPEWCGYHEALRGELGCWSLLDFSEGGLRTKISHEFCKGCDCYISKH